MNPFYFRLIALLLLVGGAEAQKLPAAGSFMLVEERVATSLTDAPARYRSSIRMLAPGDTLPPPPVRPIPTPGTVTTMIPGQPTWATGPIIDPDKTTPYVIVTSYPDRQVKYVLVPYPTWFEPNGHKYP